MTDSLKPGLTATRRITVDAPRTIDFMGDELRVYATPALIADIEHLCRDLILDHLDDGQDSVGARVEVDHLAPTLLGMSAEVTATVASCEGRLVTFEVSARDDVEEIARGEHRRFVVDVDKTKARLADKAARAGSA